MLEAARPKGRAVPNCAIRETVLNLAWIPVVAMIGERCASARLLFSALGSLWRRIHDIGPIAAEREIVGGSVDVFEIPTPLPIARFLDLALQVAEESFVVVHGKFDGLPALQVRAQYRRKLAVRRSQSAWSKAVNSPISLGAIGRESSSRWRSRGEPNRMSMGGLTVSYS